MKQAQCAKCGFDIIVADEHDESEDMALCEDCDAYECERFEQEQRS